MAHDVFFDEIEEGGFDAMKQDYLEEFDDGSNAPGSAVKTSSERSA